MARQMSFFWWALTYITCTGEEKSLPTAPSLHRQLGHLRRWRNPLVYRPLLDLLTMEERHLIITYRFDCATIQVPFQQEDGPDGGVVAAVEPVEPVDSDEEEAEEEDIDNRESVIQQYFQ
ncbi:hypothetical protein NDU88_003104 [Pleurodeles waltl]|uniref:Uncharacterized protein n=1 Tax=Pleurodeles waltl TaxID=8319 RepID=A0AAV7RDD4_PLEWA|nr:hypothetical protein NDU88_003104 [Pleurodeles waltl]